MNFSRLIAILWLVMVPACGEDFLPWAMVRPANDSRPADVREYDEQDSAFLVTQMDANEKPLYHRMRWTVFPLARLLDHHVPFCEMRFDSIHPMAFTDEEKKVLKDYFERGGFLLLFEDAYPYEQELFRQKRDLPVFDYLIHDLPAQNADFTTGRLLDDSHPIFHTLHRTETVEGVRSEIRENPNYRGRTTLYYRGAMVAIFIGRYGTFDGTRWERMPRPFAGFSSDIRSYYLILNIYVYAMFR